jgi:hypothetical protein
MKMLPVEMNDGPQNREAGDHHAAARQDKKILDEFIEVTGFHRKHAIRALRRSAPTEAPKPAAPRSRQYDEAVVRALTILWEAADRVCGKRLKCAIPTLLDAMERHGHLQPSSEVRGLVLAASAATIDRVLASAGIPAERNAGYPKIPRVRLSTTSTIR